MATEGDKLHDLISRMVAIETDAEQEQPAEEVVQTTTEATTASRQDLESSLNHLYNILTTITHDDQSDVFQSEAEELMAEELIGTIAEFKARIEGDVGSFADESNKKTESSYEDEQQWGRMEGDHENLSDEEFEKKYGKTKQEARKLYPIEPNEDINQKEQDSAESYLQYIDELTKELAHDKNSEHFHKDIAHQIQNAVDDLRNNVIGTKPSQARAKFSDQSGKL